MVRPPDDHRRPGPHPGPEPTPRSRHDRPKGRGTPIHRLRRRVVVLVVVLLLMLGTLVGRLTQIQLVDSASAAPLAATSASAGAVEDALSRAETDPSLTTITIPATRGRILDRSGVPLADNEARPTLTLDRAILAGLTDDEQDRLLTNLAEALETTPDRLRARTTSCGAPDAAPPPDCTPGSPAAPATIATEVTAEQALAIVERPDRYPGVSITPVASRAYPHPEGLLAPHVLGYLAPGEPQEEQGRTGLEEQYDAVLRGTPGHRVVRTDARGIPTEVVAEQPPTPGRDVRTHLDAHLQATIEGALAERVEERKEAGKAADGAAAVVIDLTDGGVRALASYPTYDPALWIGGIDPADYTRLTAPDSSQPLISRVTEVGLPPASTFKVVTMPAAVKAGTSLSALHPCPSRYVIGGREFRNFRYNDYGMVDWREAMAVSCDTIFYQAAYESWRAQGGIEATDDSRDPFLTTAREFGLGEPTGIDLPNEASGVVPDRAWRQARWEATKERTCARARTGYPEVADEERRAYLHQIAKENCVDGYLYRGGDAANFSIGQGDTLTTPLQMAQVFAAVATGGPTFVPQVADAFVDPVSEAVEDLAPEPGRTVPLDPKVGAYLRDSLEAVVTEGTAAGPFEGFPLEQWPVAGKTGTAEMAAGNDTSWFVSYAPAGSPRYVVAVAVTQAGLGSEAAVPIARLIHDELRRME
ncbi:penicillin-binding protein [Nostocoides sp. F2B08]|uniref:penicillin-binding transpeptidase domain-containing protein n=1 Tax=Nostocoides sp. F2B08 TaxID=2653936 RepID=UPI001263C7A7|nr:penicillin-binding transpeptidase domain-containing protein [Tetrasphaera sp. F2B08]KAB7743328.1 penicillin-binding protein [Tetrasphaera sp. F2B08]